MKFNFLLKEHLLLCSIHCIWDWILYTQMQGWESCLLQMLLSKISDLLLVSFLSSIIQGSAIFIMLWESLCFWCKTQDLMAIAGMHSGNYNKNDKNAGKYENAFQLFRLLFKGTIYWKLYAVFFFCTNWNYHIMATL